MKRCRWAWTIFLAAVAALPAGCGRPSIPGRQFRGERVGTTASAPTTSPLPEQPYLEWGPSDAKVRVLAFFPIDDEHRRLIDVLKGLADEYPGKLYVKYVDYRTPEGRAILERSEMTSLGLLINGESSVEIKGEPHSRTVDFFQEMGRFWTSADLKAAVAQEIAKVYGKAGTVRK